MSQVKRAILSVSDKTGIVDFGKGLSGMGVEILSTGGTARELSSNGVNVTLVEDHTGSPEILDGRVKTLHPRIHGGILARRTEFHLTDLARIGADYIDMVAVNLYPFEQAAAKGVPLDELVEQIDIGGPCMIRAAAKNFERLVVVCDPADYGRVLDQLSADKCINRDMRMELALKAFRHTARYDAAIVEELNRRFEAGERL